MSNYCWSFRYWKTTTGCSKAYINTALGVLHVWSIPSFSFPSTCTVPGALLYGEKTHWSPLGLYLSVALLITWLSPAEVGGDAVIINSVTLLVKSYKQQNIRKVRVVFNIEYWKWIGFVSFYSVIGLQDLSTKTIIMPSTCTCIRALCQIHVMASYSDWLIALFASAVIGQSNCFGLGFMTLIWKHSIMCINY